MRRYLIVASLVSILVLGVVSIFVYNEPRYHKLSADSFPLVEVTNNYNSNKISFNRSNHLLTRIKNSLSDQISISNIEIILSPDSGQKTQGRFLIGGVDVGGVVFINDNDQFIIETYLKPNLIGDDLDFTISYFFLHSLFSMDAYLSSPESPNNQNARALTEGFLIESRDIGESFFELEE